MKKIIGSMALMAIFAYACSKGGDDGGTNNPPPPPPGGNNCDTADMHYMANVVPILQANCYTCHGTNSNSGSNGIVLEGYDNIVAKAQNGTLIGVITHAEGFPPMPQDGAKLPDCSINKIRSWVNNGAQNN
jgi:hypothetical protein